MTTYEDFIGKRSEYKESLEKQGYDKWEMFVLMDEYDKAKNNIQKALGNERIKEIQFEMVGGCTRGKTPTGKRFEWVANHGQQQRSLNCVSLVIEGQGTVFTSGTIQKAIQRILQY